jgi:hypothetical protein
LKTANEREFSGSDFNHKFSLISTNPGWMLAGCGKTLPAVVADQETLRPRFPAQPDGLHGLGLARFCPPLLF